MKKFHKISSASTQKYPTLLIGLILAGILGILVSAGFILMIVFGLDNKYFGSSITGYVRDSSGKPLSDVSIQIQNRSTISNADGFFRIDELKYGVFNIKLELNGFYVKEESIKLKRFMNQKNFQLSAQEYGEVTYQLIFDSQTFYTSDFSIRLNDQELQLNKGYQLSTGRLLTGKYQFKLQSPYYEDQIKEVNILSGSFNENIYLVTKGDIKAQIHDFLTNEALVPDRVQLKQGEIYIDAQAGAINQNQLDIIDLQIGEVAILKVSKKGYLDFEQNIQVEPGENSLGAITLVPLGKILVISQEAGNSIIKAVNFDGSSPVDLAQKSGQCKIIKMNLQQALVQCTKELLVITISSDGAQILNTIFLNSEKFTADYGGNNFYQIGTSQQIIDQSGDFVLEVNEVITSIKYLNSTLFFTTENAIYRWNSENKTSEKLTDGNFIIVDSMDQSLLLLNYADATKSNIWVLNCVTSVKTKYSFLPGNYRNVQFSSDGSIFYLKQIAADYNLYKNSNTTSLLDHIEQMNLIQNTKFLLVTKNTGHFMYNIETGTLAKINL
ncbi:MAG: carboxypeptidase-like regulatory domain-containing protein [bacterium]